MFKKGWFYMKKKLLFALILVVFALSVSSCKIIGGDKQDGGDLDEAPSGVIFAPGVEVSIIAEPNVDYGYVETIIEAISALTGEIPTLEAANCEKTENTIVIGHVDRALSNTAYERLERYHPEVD